ncbi:MAP kinase [Mycena filopes]|nr:MAP kinase [Mycena filopes]
MSVTAERKGRRVQLYVANPGSDSSDDDTPRHYQYPAYRYNPPPLPPAPAPLSTRVPRYPPSHPSSLSSPSSTSSPAQDESTPPPSTPGLGPLEDHEEPRQKPRPPPRRTLSPIDPPVADRVLILVTADSERYVNVDISGATNPAFIRECVFTKLNIYDEEDQAHFSIYRTEIGSFAIGDALSDDRLFELCRDLGDDKGSLKLLVSHSSARVHEPPRLSASLSPTSTILPPFIPFPAPSYAPLQVRPRSRSRNDSVSSASENLPAETAGYDADQERDRERDRGRDRATLRPGELPYPGTSTGLVVPSDSRRPTSPLPSRSSSPLPPTRAPPALPLFDKFGNLVAPPPPPPPLSPNRATFNVNGVDDNLTPPGTQVNARVVVDPRPPSEPDRDDGREDGRHLRNRPHTRGTRVDTSSRRHRSKAPAQSDVEDSPSQQSDSWVMINNGTHDPDHPLTPNDTRNDTRSSPSSAARAAARQQLSPRHTKPSSPFSRGLSIPAHPRGAPPPIPAISSPDSRPPTAPRAGQPVPYKWAVNYKGPERGEQPKAMPTSSATWSRIIKTAKSMDNLRPVAHPATLTPGNGRNNTRVPPLPTTRRDQTLSAGAPTSGLGTPKYDGRQVRPLPIQGSAGSSHTVIHEQPYRNGSMLMSPSNDPYPRPQSAFGDSMTSPNQRYQQQFPTGSSYGSNLDYRSPRAPSPTHPFPTSLPYRTNRASEVRHSDPQQSPASPRSPRFISRDRRPGSSSSSMGDPPEITTTDTGMSEDSRWATKLMDSATLMPESLTFIPGDTASMISTMSYESEDSDDNGTGTWKVAPTAERPKSILRGPPLTVETNTLKPQQHASFAAGSTPASQQRPRSPSPAAAPPPKSRAAVRGSTFTAREEDTWAPRPPPEDVYERLEDFFPEHDLDKPVIEAISGGTSPTGTGGDQVIAPPLPAPSRVRGKKSIRLVAQERKKYIDRTSRGGDAFTAIQRKRSTKLWGSRVEEVDTSSLPESPSTSEGPTTFKWVRGELIGRGTYGRVYLALNATTGEMIAVKQVEIPRTASDKKDSRQVTVVQALKLESETLKVLDHPNIVQYLGFEETPANLSIFLEYVPGGSIGSCLLRHGKFDEEVTKSFTSQILAGLEYLHLKGILHRDLKSDNILVETTGVCKISDFGISKRTDDQNDAHTAMQGTVFWMAPEVINTQKKGYSFKIDIWSIGCVVLEMWAGTRPWLGDEVVAVMFKLFQSKLPPPVPDGLVLTPLADDFRRKCFAINPEERPTAAELRKHPYLTLSPGWVFDGFASKN